MGVFVPTECMYTYVTCDTCVMRDILFATRFMLARNVMYAILRFTDKPVFKREKHTCLSCKSKIISIFFVFGCSIRYLTFTGKMLDT